ncbi:MAG TPA: hypothetical protein VEC99_11990 [Clostridia bacterium]|nr:hypothetical protein [Clostridia bacterium]
MGKASREKRLRREHLAAQQMLVERAQRSKPDQPIKFIKRRTGPKVSEMLVEIAKPWLAEARNDDHRKMVLVMAVLAWNMAVFQKPDLWEGMNPELVEKLGEPGRTILDDMIASKLDLYPEETQAIQDYEITGSGDNLRIDVLYSPSPEDIKNLDLDKPESEPR